VKLERNRDTDKAANAYRATDQDKQT